MFTFILLHYSYLQSSYPTTFNFHFNKGISNNNFILWCFAFDLLNDNKEQNLDKTFSSFQAELRSVRLTGI